MHLARLRLNAGIAGLLEERSGLSDNFRPPENKICLSPKAFCSRKWFDFFGASYARSRYQRAFDRLWRGPNLRNRANLFPAIAAGDQRDWTERKYALWDRGEKPRHRYGHR